MSESRATAGDRPNILVLCMDQWDAHMRLPDAVRLPAMRRLESQGVSFDRQYCTVPICTPSRATMWTGVHAKQTGLWDNTNFAWIGELSQEDKGDIHTYCTTEGLRNKCECPLSLHRRPLRPRRWRYSAGKPGRTRGAAAGAAFSSQPRTPDRRIPAGSPDRRR
jgi:hypothetical protein